MSMTNSANGNEKSLASFHQTEIAQGGGEAPLSLAEVTGLNVS